MSAMQFSRPEPIRLVTGQLTNPEEPTLHLDLNNFREKDAASLAGFAIVREGARTATPPNPPADSIAIPVLGPVHGLGVGRETRVFTLSGQRFKGLPGPTIGAPEERFTATFVTDQKWRRHGSFCFGGRWVHNVPIAPENID